MTGEVDSGMQHDRIIQDLNFYLADIQDTGSDTEKLSVRGTVREDFPGFEGHFPGQPILAGAFQLEMLGIAARLLVGVEAQIVEVSTARFRKMLGPGDHLVLSVTRGQTGDRGTTVKGVINRDAERACQATLVLRPVRR